MLEGIKASIEVEPQYYRDTEGDSSLRWISYWKFSALNSNFDIASRHTDAWGWPGHHRVDETLLEFSSNPHEALWISGGLGNAFIDDHSGNVVGSFFATTVLRDNWITAGIYRDVLGTRTPTIANRIIETSYTFSAHRNLIGGLLAQIDYHFQKYSDFNHANELQPSLSYTLHFGPVENTPGYRFHFSDFARTTSHGYFTPSDLFEHEAFDRVAYRRENYFLNAEVSWGHRSFNTNGYPSSNYLAWGRLEAGYSLTNTFKLQLEAEGGNYQVGLPAAWSYFTIGLKTTYVF